MIKLLTQLTIAVGETDEIINPTSKQLVINRKDMVIRRYTGRWENFKIYTVKEFDNISDDAVTLHKSKLLSKVTVEEGKDLVDIDFGDFHFNRLNGVEYEANNYTHPITDLHLNKQQVALFDSYTERIADIDRRKISLVDYDKSANMVDFKGSNYEVLCSVFLENVNLLENMMLNIIKMEEIINKLIQQDLPVLNKLLSDYLKKLHSLYDILLKMYRRIKTAEEKLQIERESFPGEEIMNKFIEKRMVRN